MASIYEDKKTIGDVEDAIYFGEPLEVILDLARKIRNPNRKEFSGNEVPPVHTAVYYNNVALIKPLIKELNFRPDASWDCSRGNLTPVHIAVELKNIDAFKALLAFQPDLTLKAKFGQQYYAGTVLDLIEKIKDKKIKEEFLKAVKETPKRELSGQVDETKKFITDEDAQCPICIEVPEPGTVMRMCTKCGANFCADCTAKITSCAMCRVSFNSTSTVRNRAAEFVVKKFWEQ